MALKLPDHSHCVHCGDPIPFGEQYCDGKCQESFAKESKRTRIKDFAFYATVALALIVIVYAYIL
jgi:predicted nucleic acid-binding Zn ribbon protein